MFEHLEEKKEPRDKRITVRFTNKEVEEMNNIIEAEYNGKGNFTMLIRQALGEFIKSRE